MNNNDEREIDILDLCFRLLAKWRVILLWVIIAGVITAGIVTAKAIIDKDAADVEKQLTKSESSIQKAKALVLKEEDSKKLLANAENAYESYKRLKERQKQAKEYMNKSLYYKLDANNITRIELIYSIDNHYEVTYPVVDTHNNIDDIMNSYSSSIEGVEMSEYLIENTGLNTEHRYIQELIGAWAPTSGLYKIVITYDDIDMANTISDLIQAKMPEITKEINANYGKVDCKLQSVQTVTSVDTGISDSQKGIWDSYLSYQPEIDKLEDSLKSVDKDYYLALIGADQLRRAAEEEQKKVSLLSLISKKLILIGLAIGFIIPVGIYTLLYILKDTVKTVDEFGDSVNATVLGTYLYATKKSEKKKLLLDKCVAKYIDAKATKMDAANSDMMISQAIAELAKTNDCKLIDIISSEDLTKESDSLKGLFAKLDELKVNYSIAGNLLSDASSLKAINESDGVIIIETINQISHRELKRELEFLNLYKINVLGCIAKQEKSCK